MSAASMVQDFVSECRKRGLPVTPQRVAIYGAVAELGHPSLEEVRDILKSSDPTIALGTIYRTLAWLQDEGFIDGLQNDARNEARFDATVRPHHHLICRSCGRIEDLPELDINIPKFAPRDRHGFIVEKSSLLLTGLCPKCSPGRRKSS